MTTQHNGEDEIQHSNAPSDGPDEALHCSDELRQMLCEGSLGRHYADRLTPDGRENVEMIPLEWALEVIHQREQSLTKSLLAEVEERVIGVNEPEDAEDCKWGHDFNAGNRNELRFGQRQTLKAIRQERLGK